MLTFERNGKRRYLRYLLVVLLIIGLLGAFIIPEQYAFGKEDAQNEQEAPLVEESEPNPETPVAGGSEQEPESGQSVSGASAGISAFSGGVGLLAAGDGWDLFNYVKDVQVLNNDRTPHDGGPFEYRELYIFSFLFAEFAGVGGQFDYKYREIYSDDDPRPSYYLEYKLPSQLTVLTAVERGEIYAANGKVLGWYNIDLEGNIEVWFDDVDNQGEPISENFIYRYGNCEFTLEAAAMFLPGVEGGKIRFGAEAEITVELVYPPPGIRVLKGIASYDPTEEIVSYIVVITAPESNQYVDPPNLKDIKLIDIPRIGEETSLKPATPNAYSGISYSVDDGETWVEITGDVKWITPAAPTSENPVRLEYDFPENVGLAPGKSITVRYDIDVKKLFPANDAGTTRNKWEYDFTLNNTITAKSDEYEDKSTTGRHLRKLFGMSKSGVRKGNTVDWSASIGDGTRLLNGGVVRDLMTRSSSSTNTGGDPFDIKFPAAEDIRITFYNVDGDKIGDFNLRDFVAEGAAGNPDNTSPVGTVPSTGVPNWSIAGRTFSFTVPEANVVNPKTGEAFGEIYKIDIAYTADMVAPTPGFSSSSVTYRNFINFDGLVRDGSVITFRAPAITTKTGALTTGNPPYIVWTGVIGNGTGPLSGNIVDTLMPPAGYTMTLPGGLDAISAIRLYKAPSGTPTASAGNPFTDADLIGTFTSAELDDYLALNAEGFTFTVPPNTDANPKTEAPFGDIYRVEIVYRTDISPELPSGDILTFRNDIGYGTGTPGTGTVVYRPTAAIPTITKESSQIKMAEEGQYAGEYVIEYKINAKVPAGNRGQNYYIRDVLHYQTVASNTNNTTSYVDLGPLAELADRPGLADRLELKVELVEPENDFRYYVGRPGTYYFDIYFGPEGGTPVTTTSNSRWQYSEEKDLIITYTFPLSTRTANNQRSVEEILNNPTDTMAFVNRLINNVYWRTDVNGASTTISSASVLDVWPIYKTVAKPTGDGTLFDYTVYINPSSSATASHRMRLFEAGEPAIFIDEFDEALEYVPGSFWVVDRGVSPVRYYAPCDEAKNDMTDVSVENMIKVDFAEMKQFSSWGDSVNAGTTVLLAPNGEPQTPGWYAIRTARIEVHYQLRVKDEYYYINGEAEYRNDATIVSTVMEQSYSSHASVLYENSPLSKEMMTNNSDVVEVAIIINPDGAKLAPHDHDWFYAEDEMSEGLALFVSSIELFVQDEEGEWKPQPINPSADGLWSVSYASERNVTFKLPDETPVRIVYKAVINLPLGEPVSFRNQVTVEGYIAEAARDQYLIQNTAARAEAGDMPLSIIKRDADVSDRMLPGAEFKLYMAIPRGGYYDSNSDETEKITYGGKDFFLIMPEDDEDGPDAVVTGGDGIARFVSKWLAPSYGATYLIVETESPGGYYAFGGPDNYTFFVLHDMGSGELEAWTETFGDRAAIINSEGIPLPKLPADAVYITNIEIWAEAEITGTKEITGRDLSNRTFTFIAEQVTTPNGNTLVEGGLSGTATPDEAGEFTIAFEDLAAGTYYFRVSEDQMGTNTGGWKYDDGVFWATITVGDNGDGTPDVSVAYDSDSITFTNKYEAAPVSVALNALKTATGSEMAQGQFEFSLYKSDATGAQAGDALETVSNGAVTSNSAPVEFEELEFDKTGDYYYLIKEAGPGAGGWFADEREYHVYVAVADDGQGLLEAEVKYRAKDPETGAWGGWVTTYSAAASPTWPVFENRFVADCELTLTGTKIAHGQVTDEVFTFWVVDVSEEDDYATLKDEFLSLTAEEKAALAVSVGTWPPGEHIVFSAITYGLADAGEYVYMVFEDTPLPVGWSTTTDFYLLYVAVEVNADILTATAYKDPEHELPLAGNELMGYLEFTNSYAATGSWTPMGTKTVAGAVLAAGQFTFELYASDANGEYDEEDDLIQNVKNTAGGGVTFNTIQITEEGTKYYVMKEIAVAAGGWTFDETEYLIRVAATDNGAGGYTTVIDFSTNGGSTWAAYTGTASATFANSYNVSGSWTPLGMKTVAGAVLEAGQFTFELYASDANGEYDEVGDQIQSVTNAAGGGVTFNTIPITAEGTKYYVMKEIAVATAGWTFDETEYLIRVTATDNKAGVYTTVIDVSTDGGSTWAEYTGAASATFANSYGAAGEWAPDAVKSTLGRTLGQAAGLFEFELYETDADGTPLIADPVLTGTNAADGSITFDDAIGYALADAGATYYYLLKEVIPNPILNGWTYTTVEFLFAVTVSEDDGTGTLTAVTGAIQTRLSDQDEFEEYEGDVAFANEYDANGDWTPGAVKAVEGLDLAEATGLFTFNLYELNADLTYKSETPIKTGTNAAGGTISFTAVEYGLADAGTTKYYLMKETPVTLRGWTGTTVEYLFAVTIGEDTGAGSLTPTAIIQVRASAEDEFEAYTGVATFVNTFEDSFIPNLSVEVDKDTIKRTSAAFDGTAASVTAGGQLINNVGAAAEQYRYDINFRSTANTDADEFVVDDPLEAVRLGQVYLTGLWTPAVWGDKDGRFNVWYKTAYPARSAGSVNLADPNPAITTISNPVYPTNRGEGWKLWTTVDQSGTALFNNTGVIDSVRLYVTGPAGLGLGQGDYVTAIRFEFGPVRKGFTSRNYDDGKAVNNGLNEQDDIVRNTNGAGGYVGGQVAKLESPIPAVSPFEAIVAFFTGEVSAKAVQSTPEDDVPEKGASNNWTPVPDSSYYNPDIAGINSTKEGSPLAGAAYLVSARGAMHSPSTDIVSSAAAFIALGGAGAGGLFDQDQDAVLTRVITPFVTEPEGFDFASIEVETFFDNAFDAGLVLINGVWYDSDGRRVNTGDPFAENLWLIIIGISIACIMLLMWKLVTLSRKDRKKDIVSTAVKGGGRK